LDLPKRFAQPGRQQPAAGSFRPNGSSPLVEATGSGVIHRSRPERAFGSSGATAVSVERAGSGRAIAQAAGNNTPSNNATNDETSPTVDNPRQARSEQPGEVLAIV
jgi:hypothetical protein